MIDFASFNKSMERILNNLFVRIIIGGVIGIPLTGLALVAGVHGIVLGYAGVEKGDFLLAMVGLVTIIGFIGISGAWRRLLKPTNLMTQAERKVTRIMLFFGFFSSLGMAVWSLYIDGISELSLFLVTLSLGGGFFITGTPKNAL